MLLIQLRRLPPLNALLLLLLVACGRNHARHAATGRSRAAAAAANVGRARRRGARAVARERRRRRRQRLHWRGAVAVAVVVAAARDEQAQQVVARDVAVAVWVDLRPSAGARRPQTTVTRLVVSRRSPLEACRIVTLQRSSNDLIPLKHLVFMPNHRIGLWSLSLLRNNFI